MKPAHEIADREDAPSTRFRLGRRRAEYALPIMAQLSAVQMSYWLATEFPSHEDKSAAMEGCADLACVAAIVLMHALDKIAEEDK